MDELHAKEAAKLSIANAAAAGIVAKDMKEPCDYEVHHNTVVDHNTPFYSSPAVVAHDTTVYKKTPVMFKNDAVVTSDYYPGMAVTGPALAQSVLKKPLSLAVPQLPPLTLTFHLDLDSLQLVLLAP